MSRRMYGIYNKTFYFRPLRIEKENFYVIEQGATRKLELIFIEIPKSVTVFATENMFISGFTAKVFDNTDTQIGTVSIPENSLFFHENLRGKQVIYTYGETTDKIMNAEYVTLSYQGGDNAFVHVKGVY